MTCQIWQLGILMYKKEVLRPGKIARVGIWLMLSLERAWNHIHFSRISDQLKDTEFWLHFGNILGTTKNSSEPRHDKINKVTVRPAKTQISLGIRPVWSESLLSAWRKLGSLATHWAHSEDSDQTGQMPRLIWVFAGHTLTLLVLSCRGSSVCQCLL